MLLVFSGGVPIEEATSRASLFRLPAGRDSQGQEYSKT